LFALKSMVEILFWLQFNSVKAVFLLTSTLVKLFAL
jgi:hypothetical protein